jgi:hypothetical protein
LTAPVGTPQALAAYLQKLEDGISAALNPQGPTLLFACLRANLPDPVSNINRVARVTDTNILVASDGVHWINQKTGAPV